jgi:hypothetical protein
MRAKDHPNNAPGVPMIFPPLVERLQVKYFNPMIKPIARFLPGMATIKHRGRKSGKPYETIVTAYRKGNVLAIALGEMYTSSIRGSCPPAAAQRDCRGWPDCRRAGSAPSSPISLDRADTLTPWRGKSG